MLRFAREQLGEAFERGVELDGLDLAPHFFEPLLDALLLLGRGFPPPPWPQTWPAAKAAISKAIAGMDFMVSLFTVSLRGMRALSLERRLAASSVEFTVTSVGFVLQTSDPSTSGVAEGALKEFLERAEQASSRLADISFVADLSVERTLPSITSLDRVAVLGIGGSALGSRCVAEACGAPRPLHVVDNIDPDALASALDAGDPARTHWVVISKSGGTTETMAQCAYVREKMRALDAWSTATIVTGPDGALRELAEGDGLEIHEVPVPVGGRFSVFTPAATVPLALCGADVGALLAGARTAAEQAQQPGSAAAQLASQLVAAELSGRNVVALWAYAERLESIGEWFRQLWAESLGKVRPDGTRAGQTPLHCVGTTDSTASSS